MTAEDERRERERLIREAQRYCSACGFVGGAAPAGSHRHGCPRSGMPADQDCDSPTESAPQ